MDRPPSRRNRSALGGGGPSSIRPSGRGRRRPPRSSSTIPSNSTPPHNNNNTTPSTIPTRPRPSRTKNRHRRRPPPSTLSQPQPVLKVIVRRLPPTLSADDFAKEANPRGADRAVWRTYRPGSLANIGTLKRTTHVVRHSVAYLAFSDIQHAIDFHNQFTGFKFVETNNNSSPPLIGSSSPINSSTAITPSARPRPGTEYVAKVERAMWQATPPPTRKRTPTNSSQGTIESDPDYISFCEKLQSEGRGEDARKSSMSVVQTSELFSTGKKLSGSMFSDHSTPISLDDRNKTKVSTTTSPANSKSNIVTPLMEDVRARRKERDQKKKPPKSTPRSVRGKGRLSPAIDLQKTVPETPTKNSARKKKRRGNEGSNGDKRNDDSNHQDNRSRTPKPPPPFRENSNVKSDNHVVGNESNSSSGQNHSPNPTSGRANGRNASNRSRYGRSPRARGKFSPNRNAVNSPRNEFPPSPSASHNSVRLLKKEASATEKT